MYFNTPAIFPLFIILLSIVPVQHGGGMARMLQPSLSPAISVLYTGQVVNIHVKQCKLYWPKIVVVCD